MGKIIKKVKIMSKTQEAAKIVYPTHEKAFILTFPDPYPIDYVFIGITYPFPNYRIRRKANGYSHLFEYVVEGEGEAYVDGERIKVRGGDLLVFRKDALQNYKSNANAPMKKLWINFTGEYLDRMLTDYRIHTGIYHIDLRKEFESLYHIAKLDTKPQDKYFEIIELLHGIILKTSRFLLNNTQTPIDSIKNALLASIYSKKTLDEIASELFTSKSNLIRAFKKQTGYTPYQFLLTQRFQIAKNLLSTTSMPIKAIADLLCFSDEHYFSFLFKQKMGVTPSKYRNSFQTD